MRVVHWFPGMGQKRERNGGRPASKKRTKTVKVLYRKCKMSETSSAIKGMGKEGKNLRWLTILVFGDMYGISKCPGPIMELPTSESLRPAAKN